MAEGGHAAGGCCSLWELELQIPRSYQELLFLLVPALLTAPQGSEERFLSSHLLRKGDSGRGRCELQTLAGDTQAQLSISEICPILFL